MVKQKSLPITLKNCIMKKIYFLFVAVFSIVFISCEGDTGPQGPPGIDGGLIASQAFEIELDFNQANNYEFVEPYGFEVLPTDVTLVFILWDELNGNEIWRILPQQVRFENGELEYNYDFTQIDVRFFLDGTVNLTTLDPVWTQNQVFRVVVVPADNLGRQSSMSLEAVMELYNITHFEKRNRS